MTNNIQTILTPLLIISFVFGSKIVELSTSRWKVLLCWLYIVLLRATYFFILIHVIFSYIIKFNVDYIIFFSLNIFISLISVIFGVHYNKKFKKCLKKIAIVDDTLKQLGLTTDFPKLHMKIVWLTLGWSVMVILLTYTEITFFRHEYNYNVIIASYITFVIDYYPYVNFINDLIIANVLGYIGLKFGQINENLPKLINKCEIRQSWINHVLDSRQRKHLKTPSNICMTWIVIHLHLELRKISREINSIFGMQMTLKMGLYFGLVASYLHIIFNTILIRNNIHKRMHLLAVMLCWEMIYAFQVFLINCICERVSIKANTIKSFINRISYSTCNVEVHENITQLMLNVIQSPLRFYGIGLFQFGFKFLYKFSASITTVVVILVQVHVNNHQ